jgi:hypothetical protein
LGRPPPWSKPSLSPLPGRRGPIRASTLSAPGARRRRGWRNGEARHPGVLRRTGGEMVRTGEEAAAWARALDRETVDGVVAVTLTSGSDGMVLAVARGGLPTLLWNQPYLGHAWGSMAAWVRAGNRGDVLTSSDPGDLDIYARIFYSIHMLRTSKVVVVVPERARESHGSQAAEFTRRYGTTLRVPELRRFESSLGSRVRERSRTGSRSLRAQRATRRRTLSRGNRTRFALLPGREKLLAERKANAITIDCLGGIQRRELPGYPCVAWSRLDDEGLYGVCQADLNCTMTQLLLTPPDRQAGLRLQFGLRFGTQRADPEPLHGAHRHAGHRAARDPRTSSDPISRRPREFPCRC